MMNLRVYITPVLKLVSRIHNSSGHCSKCIQLTITCNSAAGCADKILF